MTMVGRAKSPASRSQSEHPSANEIFGRLYGKNVSPQLMIDAFAPISALFKSRARAVFLHEHDRVACFDLPTKRQGQSWKPPLPLSDRDLREFERLHAEIVSGRNSDTRSIIDLAHREYGRSEAGDPRWSLLFSCHMQPSSAVSAKRSTGEIKILLLNEGHSSRCVYADKITEMPQARCAEEHHDLVAVYAAYFDQMLRDLSFVPLPLIQAEWNKALHGKARVDSGEARNRAGLPWGNQAPPETHTVTLSLDLRKSTFAMQQTRDRRAYAKWLEGVAELARSITLQNGGIFDKFTGDGVISHFVYPANIGDAEGEEQALRSAMVCAVELIQAMNLHIDRVLPQLKFRSRAFGPAIGMAVDTAAWSLDRDGKPVVVGSGIVNACRLNGGNSGDIILTNDLKHRLSRLIADLDFDEYDLGDRHKDFASSLEASCWRISGHNTWLGRREAQLQIEVDRVG